MDEPSGSRKRVFGPRILTAVLVAVLLVPLMFIAPAQAHGKRTDKAKIVREFNEDGTAAPGHASVGRTALKRTKRGLEADVRVRKLKPGGVYTFWWVAIQGDGSFPDDIYVQRGAAAVANEKGRARVHMRARTGDEGITGFPPLGGAEFGTLVDPKGAVVRIEIAYDGQATVAGDDLDLWMSDFWTGDACPPDTANPNPAQPHCPVYFASTHTP